jgi:hypothetical protein
MIALTDDTRGLLQAALGEALGGFAAGSFSAEDRSKVISNIQRLQDESPITVSADDAGLLVKVLKFVLEELGPEEFQSITGCDFDSGVAAVKSLQGAIASQNDELGN